MECLGVMGMPGIVWLVLTASTFVAAAWTPTCASGLHIAILIVALRVKIIPIIPHRVGCTGRCATKPSTKRACVWLRRVFRTRLTSVNNDAVSASAAYRVVLPDI